MLDTIITVVLLLVAAFGTGAFVDLWSFMIGDPGHDLEVHHGRILSHVGSFLLRKYKAFEARTEEIMKSRLAASIEDAQARWRLKHPGKEFPLDHPVYTADVPERVNWWKMTGLCPRCCMVWAAMVAFGVCMLAGGLSPWYWCAFVPFLGVASWGYSTAAGARE